jgi:hypothetical protein
VYYELGMSQRCGRWLAAARCRGLALSLALLILLGAWPARAAPRRVWVLPTVVERTGSAAAEPPKPDATKSETALAAPPAAASLEVARAPSDARDLDPLALELDNVLREAVRDFGFEPLAAPPASERTELALAGFAKEAWVLAPSIRESADTLRLRLVVVPQGSEVLQVRVQDVEPDALEVRSLAMLREVLAPLVALPAEPRLADCARLGAVAPEPHVRSEGRAVLALHTAALGGFLGFSLQRASGSDDARVTYPLAALGAGIGLGTAMVVAEEWDITVGRAWYLGAAVVWPGTAGLLLASSYDAQPKSKRLLYGVLAGGVGLTLATAALSLGDVDGDGAALTHSGAALGTLLGGLVDMTIKGNADFTPERGMGIGALAGVLTAGTVASQVQVPTASDLLFIDLSALLGGLAGAAVGTPLLVQERSETRDRLWLSAVIAGTLAGTAAGYWAVPSTFRARTAKVGASAPEPSYVRPQVGWVGSGIGVGLEGAW